MEWNLPNGLSLFRIVSVGPLLYLALTQQPRPFVALLISAFLSDALDGYLARRKGQESHLGTQLDSWGDFAIYVSLPFCVWWLWPEVIREEFPFVAIAISSYAFPVLFGFLKYRRLTSYHTWGAKISGIGIALGTLMLILETNLPFRFASLVLALSAIEEIAITLTLSRWTANVPSLWHALQLAHPNAKRPVPGLEVLRKKAIH